MVGRFQLVDWSVSFLFKNYQNAAKRQLVWELISSEGARVYQKAKKENKIRRLHVFFESELALLVFASFFILGCILLRRKRRGDDSTAATTKNKEKLKRKVYPQSMINQRKNKRGPEETDDDDEPYNRQGTISRWNVFNIPTLNSIWFIMQQ